MVYHAGALGKVTFHTSGDLLLMVSNAVKELKFSRQEIEELKSMLDQMGE